MSETLQVWAQDVETTAGSLSDLIVDVAGGAALFVMLPAGGCHGMFACIAPRICSELLARAQRTGYHCRSFDDSEAAKAGVLRYLRRGNWLAEGRV